MENKFEYENDPNQTKMTEKPTNPKQQEYVKLAFERHVKGPNGIIFVGVREDKTVRIWKRYQDKEKTWKNGKLFAEDIPAIIQALQVTACQYFSDSWLVEPEESEEGKG